MEEEAKEEREAEWLQVNTERQEDKESSRRAQEMTLNDFIKTAINSDRLLIQDSNGNELYRGFIGCLQYRDIDGERKVKQHGISTEVYTTKTIKKGVAVWKEQGERVTEENTGLYKYSDLQMLVFTKLYWRNEDEQSV